MSELRSGARLRIEVKIRLLKRIEAMVKCKNGERCQEGVR
jgi:hypothetical protein